MFHQIENINKETNYKKNQMEILELKSTIIKSKNKSIRGTEQLIWICRRKNKQTSKYMSRDYVSWKTGNNKERNMWDPLNITEGANESPRRRGEGEQGR